MSLTYRLLLLLAFGWSLAAEAEQRLQSYLPASGSIRCAGNQELTIEQRHIDLAGHAIEAHGNCRVQVLGAHVLADGIAILATGNATVIVDRSFIQGTEHAIKVTGNAVVNYQDSTVRGAIFAAAGGSAIDGGGNTVERLPNPVWSPLSKAAPHRCGDRERLVLLHRSIDTSVSALEVDTGCHLTLSDSYLAAGKGIYIAAGGKAVLRNSVVEADVQIEVGDGGFLHVAGSSISNGIRVVGEGTVVDGGGNAWER